MSKTEIQGTKVHRQTEPSGRLILSSPVALALNIIGDRWSFLILRDIFLGIRRFEDLRRRTDAARGTLTARLSHLVASGILYRKPYQASPARYEYRVTEKGADLYPLALMAWRWEHDWGEDEEHFSPERLLHQDCGRVTLPETCCEHCSAPVKIWDVQFARGPGPLKPQSIRPRHQRRSRAKSSYPEGVDTKLFHLADVMGDRWTGLVIASLFFGIDRYDGIGSAIGIATNILADRLRLLTRAGVIKRKVYQRQPTRYAYHLTEKGRDLYGYALMLHQWAERWMVKPGRSPLSLTHKLCGQPLRAKVICSECREVIQPNSLTFTFHEARESGAT
jgi:DNA-binding HxlR family transcriptional regulator